MTTNLSKDYIEGKLNGAVTVLAKLLRGRHDVFAVTLELKEDTDISKFPYLHCKCYLEELAPRPTTLADIVEKIRQAGFTPCLVGVLKHSYYEWNVFAGVDLREPHISLGEGAKYVTSTKG